MGLSAQHFLLLMIVALLLFGRGKISELMGDVAKGNARMLATHPWLPCHVHVSQDVGSRPPHD